ncbi:MAG: YbhB/YbcL family Raf kinase inhibitor-like protein [Candidatus Humimicrobiaceae bacterium]|jgi:Raf kinase inhibitor-like YbhB/YbcL family protein|nr:YbhB/YbcL family Raf kinase inhibitor-like protein [Actinomycetota bacterium]MDD5600544.1 YbhB/YbcL family Raf kinase inhibitor-like protein [Actinomycetota bacterium]MDY0028173.1 YbhB/YbcL family Raf kinase inhibitor-like protein [Candidatus Humimicrobiaceae bacterium]
MKIESPAFKNNEFIPSKYTCDGENINPPLIISDVPEDAKSLVLIVDDPDAPGGTWVHWTIWNISPDTKEIKEDSCPPGAVEGMTDSGRPGYSGPCPPYGTHRYFFKLFALDTTLDLDTSSRVADIEHKMEENIVAKAQLVGLYKRG